MIKALLSLSSSQPPWQPPPAPLQLLSKAAATTPSHLRPPSPTPNTTSHHPQLLPPSNTTSIFIYSCTKWVNFIFYLVDFCFWFLVWLVFIVGHAILIRVRVIFEVFKGWSSIKACESWDCSWSCKFWWWWWILIVLSEILWSLVLVMNINMFMLIYVS